MKRVVVFGTFDVLHPGHVWFLRRAKQHGNQLIVVVARDAMVWRIKKRKPHFTERERLRMVQSLALVDRALLGDRPGAWSMLIKLHPDVICIGYDQERNHPALRAQSGELKKKPRIIRIRAFQPHRYSSSHIRRV